MTQRARADEEAQHGARPRARGHLERRTERRGARANPPRPCRTRRAPAARAPARATPPRERERARRVAVRRAAAAAAAAARAGARGRRRGHKRAAVAPQRVGHPGEHLDRGQ